MPVSSPPPYLIEQDLDRVTLTLYGTQATPDIIKFLQNDSLVRMINWVPEQSDRVRISLELSQPPYGYLVLFEPARGFVLRLRRPPRVSLARPLEGLDDHRRSRTSARRRDRSDRVDRSRRVSCRSR